MTPRTVAIIQARLGSSRLPAKTLLPLPTGRTVIEEVVFRARQIVGLDQVVVASPVGDELLARHIPGDIQVVWGSEDDVLQRYTQAAREADATHIMRITADCPVLNAEVASQVLELYLEGMNSGSCYAANCWPERTYPQGWDIEVFTRGWLELANATANSASDREHVTPWIQREARRNGHAYLLRSTEDLSGIRVTLDRLDDYREICQLIIDAAGLSDLERKGARGRVLASLQNASGADA